MRRVFITGIGPVSNIGTGVSAFTEGLRSGRSGVSAISSFDPSGFPRRLGGEVKDFEPGQLIRTLDPEQWGRSSLLAAAAARLAVEDGGLDEDVLGAGRSGVVIGTTSGESRVVDEIGECVARDGYHRMSRPAARKLPAARLSAAVSEEFGLSGESVTIATACAAGNYALGYAFDAVASSRADFMLAGGADSVCRWAHAGFVRLGAVADKACAPFDRDRTGIVTAEGGAMLLLESAASAEARGARVYAEILGYGLNCDANHMVAPNADSIARCMRLAHQRAGIRADEIEYVCTHGTGTTANDRTEVAALRDVFAGRVPPISSIKSMLGHTMGAASAFGAMACALAISEGFLPPTINWRTPDPEFADIDPVPNYARPHRIRMAQNDSFAFGGNNAIVVLAEAL